MDELGHAQRISPLLYYPFGFVGWLYLGDNSSWKIQYLDLSAVEKGEIRRDATFGYIEMPDEMSLKEAINLVDYGYDDSEPYSYTALIAIRKRLIYAMGESWSSFVPSQSVPTWNGRYVLQPELFFDSQFSFVKRTSRPPLLKVS